MEKLEDTVSIGGGMNGHASLYRLTWPNGRPLNAGLSNTIDAAAALAKSHGWRPETTSVVTRKVEPKVAKKSSNTYQEGLGFGD